MPVPVVGITKRFRKSTANQRGQACFAGTAERNGGARPRLERVSSWSAQLQNADHWRMLELYFYYNFIVKKNYSHKNLQKR